ncbi:uncharacterized protein RCC_09917 [Ramularia collo-cygni]|uniref:Uncharacterized protein n=1 Tax=Ramularia collo-cygni TaxID=112498 RepID=A0A2D3VB61_9PEZI|nr:uncharacterized protein RCC_09917 [Ramularia collo-cygni]CZT24200.1 uncharacterized protein RCC_09917 [Ramularia collo-cygni]
MTTPFRGDPGMEEDDTELASFLRRPSQGETSTNQTYTAAHASTDYEPIMTKGNPYFFATARLKDNLESGRRATSKQISDPSREGTQTFIASAYHFKQGDSIQPDIATDGHHDYTAQDSGQIDPNILQSAEYEASRASYGGKLRPQVGLKRKPVFQSADEGRAHKRPQATPEQHSGNEMSRKQTRGTLVAAGGFVGLFPQQSLGSTLQIQAADTGDMVGQTGMEKQEHDEPDTRKARRQPSRAEVEDLLEMTHEADLRAFRKQMISRNGLTTSGRVKTRPSSVMEALGANDVPVLVPEHEVQSSSVTGPTSNGVPPLQKQNYDDMSNSHASNWDPSSRANGVYTGYSSNEPQPDLRAPSYPITGGTQIPFDHPSRQHQALIGEQRSAATAQFQAASTSGLAQAEEAFTNSLDPFDTDSSNLDSSFDIGLPTDRDQWTGGDFGYGAFNRQSG